MNSLNLLRRNSGSSVDLDLDLDMNVKSTKLDLPDNTSSNQDNICNIDMKLNTSQLCSSQERQSFRQGSELDFKPQGRLSLVE